MNQNITVEGGSSVRLPTAGKYCDRDIIVTATGGGGGAEVVLQNKTVTPTKSTQNVTADTGYTALSKVTVNPIPSNYIDPSGTKTITANGTHDVNEYEKVSVNVPIPEGYIKPSGTKSITENGSHDVTAYASVNVSVPSEAPNIQPLEITENGTYTAPSGVDGFSPIVVNVAGGSTEPDPREQYQRVDYITSAEEETYPYIITDFCADNDSGVEVIASFPTLVDRIPMGSRLDTNATRFYVCYPLSSSGSYYGFNSGSTLSGSFAVNTKYICQTNFLCSRMAGLFTPNGDRKTSGIISSTLTAQTGPVSIFGFRYCSTGNVASKREYKLYGARLSQLFEVVREYIPCYRKSDGVVGLYEKFTGAFLTNDADVGSFTYGQAIEWE